MTSVRRASRRPASEFDRAQEAARYVGSKVKLQPRIALVLGSGLGGFADDLAGAVRVPYEKIPGFRSSTVEGHAGMLVIGTVGDAAVLAMQGRVHFYEGYSAKEIAFPMRVFHQLGIRAAILTNAAGAINPAYDQGALVVIRDHINLQGANPLIGPNDPRFGPRFPDMTHAYPRKYRKIALDQAGRLGMKVHEGVYAGLAGPSYETPAEIGFLKSIGADLVGMSTVAETIVARHMGIGVLGISCVTNMAAGVMDREIDHSEVMRTGERVRAQFVALLRAIIPQMAADIASGSS
jgi:purine-nucleoside phosphorylase